MVIGLICLMFLGVTVPKDCLIRSRIREPSLIQIPIGTSFRGVGD